MDLAEKQRRGFAILKEIHRICEKHKISYRLDSGTLLGAIRHEGFIPWDDDVDLCFLREEWEKFERVAKDELSENFALLMPNSYRNGRSFYDFVPRVVDLNSKRREVEGEEDAFYEGKLNHLWVDCFILDDCPRNAFLDKLYRFRQQMIFGLAMGHRRKLDFQKYSPMAKLFVAVLATLGKCFPLPFLFSLQDRWAQGARREKSQRRGEDFLYFSNYQPDFQYCKVQYSWEEPVQYKPFAGKEFPVPKDFDSVLKMLYGDYMTPPKKEEQVPSHEEMI